MLRIEVVAKFIEALFSYFFTNSKTKLFFCGKNLMLPSFRVSEEDNRDFSILFRVFKDILKKSLKRNQNFTKYNENSTSIIYDANLSSVETRIRYVKHFSGKEVRGVLGKNNIISYIGLLPFIGDVFQLILLTLILFPFYLVNKSKRGVIALVVKESIENHRLVKFCVKNKIEKIYFFSIYEKDANIAAFLLQERGIKVIKIPSEVPLTFWNKIVICDTLCVCNAYQYDEIEYYKQWMFFEKTEFWGPELMLNVASKYIDKTVFTKQNTIGFYSTAGWIRELEGHIDQGVKMAENEHIVKSYLAEYIRKNELQLIVFLHPKEKKPEYVEKVQEHYQQYFSEIDYNFNDALETTASSFEKADLVVAFNSTIIYERLYFGFKCLITPLFSEGFPIKESSITNICAFTKEELFNKIDQNLGLSNQEFFEKNNLMKYTYKSNKT